MRYQVDPRQSWLFDPVGEGLSPKSLAKLKADWAGLFRESILAAMPVDVIGAAFDPDMGRPTKELYSMCGLVLLMEFNNWTVPEAVDQYVYNMKVHYALNLASSGLELTARTLERYRRVFREKDVAELVMRDVTDKLVELLGISVDKLRLDSTHVFSNMAAWGRTRLMTEVVRQFLTQLKRHEADLHAQLPGALLDRYAKAGGWNLGAKADVEARRMARQAVAEDMHELISRFEAVEAVAKRNTFKDMVRVFGEQCEVAAEDGKVSVRDKAPSDCLQNPSDPDAAYSGHKGTGYQAQMAETCSPDNLVQLVVGVIPEPANKPDSEAVGAMLDLLEAAGHKPDEVLADTSYGSDANVEAAAARGVKLVAPASKGRGDGRLGLEDFKFDASGVKIVGCPAGHAPASSSFDEGKGRAAFDADVCAACPMLDKCPTHQHGKRRVVKYGDKELRLARRRAWEGTPQFKESYSPRAGIEGLFGCLKTTMGLGRLRVRGEDSVYMELYLKVAGHNILRAAKGLAKRGNTGDQALSAARLVFVAAVLRKWLVSGIINGKGGRKTTVATFVYAAA